MRHTKMWDDSCPQWYIINMVRFLPCVVHLSQLPSQPPILTVVVPCYNEQEVLPVTAPLFLEKLQAMASRGLIAAC